MISAAPNAFMKKKPTPQKRWNPTNWPGRLQLRNWRRFANS